MKIFKNFLHLGRRNKLKNERQNDGCDEIDQMGTNMAAVERCFELPANFFAYTGDRLAKMSVRELEKIFKQQEIIIEQISGSVYV